jgi:hypothetical protein
MWGCDLESINFTLPAFMECVLSSPKLLLRVITYSLAMDLPTKIFTAFSQYGIAICMLKNLSPIDGSAFLFATGTFALVRPRLHKYLDLNRELRESSLGNWITHMEQLGDIITLAGKDLPILLQVYRKPASFWKENPEGRTFCLWIISIGVERCLRPSDEVCLDADGVSYDEAPFSACYNQDKGGCNGKICNQKIPMGMIIRPGPNSWPPCYNMYHTK